MSSISVSRASSSTSQSSMNSVATETGRGFAVDPILKILSRMPGLSSISRCGRSCGLNCINVSYDLMVSPMPALSISGLQCLTIFLFLFFSLIATQLSSRLLFLFLFSGPLPAVRIESQRGVASRSRCVRLEQINATSSMKHREKGD
ncbi:hypothetical protein BR93DRAFT_302119 [Coniochaeta sp. PMI_546]|nr:hypothetical protein BR93DRAFT_302119 [Coniochaeta sp. PMI_546]